MENDESTPKKGKSVVVYSIEELAKKFCKESWELSAIKVQQNWASQRPCTEDEFIRAQEELWTARMG